MENGATTQANPTHNFPAPFGAPCGSVPPDTAVFSTFHHVDDRSLTQVSHDPLLLDRKRTRRRTKLAYYLIS